MDEAEARRPKRRLIVAAALGGVILLALITLWTQRKPIARNIIDAELAARGVPVTYDITEIAPGVQRVENLVLGDPARPDLTADWVELRLSYGLGWPSVRSITAQGVRLRGRLANGVISFGALDRLLPRPGGAPFALPDIAVNLADARMRLDTPYGPVGLALDGAGNLQNGFDGQLAAIAPRLAIGDCTATRTTAWVKLAIRDRRPGLDGPARVNRLGCPANGLTAEDGRIDLAGSFAETFAAWRGAAGLSFTRLGLGANRIERVSGRIVFDGDATATRGTLAFAAQRAETPQGKAGLAFDGRYGASATQGAIGLGGDLRLTGLALAPRIKRSLAGSLAGAEGTPLGPLGGALAAAIERAGRAADVRAGLAASWRSSGGRARLVSLDAASASGARATLNGGNGLSYAFPSGAIGADGMLALAGGGFPQARIRFGQPKPGGAIVGIAEVALYAAGGARLALAPVRFAGDRGAARFDTLVMLDGPIGDGRVTGLRLPVSGRIGGGAFAINPRCVPLDFTRLAIAGTVLGRSRLPLCPVGRAMLVRSARGGLRGGVQVARPTLAGRIGGAPLTMRAASLRADIGTPGFTLDRLAVRLGTGEAITRLDLDRLVGRSDAGGLGGNFEGAVGRIGTVPLLLSRGAGKWRLAGGDLTLDGGLTVADAAPDPRFNPLVSSDVRLTLAGGIIRAAGHLREPTRDRDVTAVTLTHDLSSGRGGAVLDVPGLTFAEGFQPELLTRLTIGVVANVAGTISGRGRIDWIPAGVTSSGDFATDSLALAAAFGPVSGIRGAIHFDDLLALSTPPAQSVQLGEVNPGIAVTDGAIRYRLLPDQKVAIEGGEWPFSGGRLILEPTTLDLGRPVERDLTFRVEHLDAALFLEQFKFDNIAATGTFDGRLPIIFDAQGGRIEGGRLTVAQGGGTIAYNGQVSNENLGTYGSMAFDALKSIRYQNLAIELDGRLDGEIVSRILFTGTNERPVDAAAPTGIARQFTGLPFKFNITVRAPFRGLLNTASNFADPTQLIRDQAGQAAPGAGESSVQPQESGGSP